MPLLRPLAMLLLALCTSAQAAPDEIQVYTDDINAPGEFGLELHTNFVAQGASTPAWPEQKPVRHMWRFTPEFSYGLSPSWELGFYLPMIRDAAGQAHLEGAKLRLKYIAPHADEGFYWGLNGEIGRVSKRTEQDSPHVELRPILGLRSGAWEATLNPILGWNLNAGSARTPEFSPAFKLAWHASEHVAWGLEQYASVGPLDRWLPGSAQERSTFLVFDGKLFERDVNLGLGRATAASDDRWILKAIIGF